MNTYEHAWEALEDWVCEMQHSRFVLSHLRLVLMDTWMKGLQTEHGTKVMLSQHRAQNQKIWTDEEKDDYAADYVMQKKLMEREDLVDQCLFEQEFLELTADKNRQMELQLHHNDEVLREFSLTDNTSLCPVNPKRSYDHLLHKNKDPGKGSMQNAKECRA